jgi:hypothetical protein
MTRYTGLPEGLRMAIWNRDQHRCRWCGRTNVRVDFHHIRYRRGYADDVLDNLISLCRTHHEFVHGTKAPNGDTIAKDEAQEILNDLVRMPGVTGIALRRQRRAAESVGSPSRN